MQMFFSIYIYIKKNWLIILSSLLVGATLGFLISIPTIIDLQKLQDKPLRVSDLKYPLINSLLGYNTPEATTFGELINFKSKIANLVNKEISENNASQISFSFRDLNIGHWISINKDDTYTPASLLKIPIMISYYKLAESDPEILNKQIIFDGKNNDDSKQVIVPSQKLEVGKSYTVDQLINEMIIYSDNNATTLLLKNIDSKDLNQVFLDLDVFLPTTGGVQDFISVNNYGLFFRVLYSATYLDQSDSEKALELLGKSGFKDGLVSGVPTNIAVAHKFGEFELVNPVDRVTITESEFHDCGIVYYPNKPYFLCVMTKGNDLSKLEKSVKDISKLAYDEVNTEDD